MDYSGFAVAAYRKPQVDLQLQFTAPDVKAGNDLQANLSAKYYFGSPAAKLPVNWTLYAMPDWMALPDGYQAGIQDPLWSNLNLFGGLGQEISSGSGTTGINGSLNITIPANEQDRLDTRTLNHLTLEATLEDQSNSPVSARTSMQLHPADVYIGVRPDAWGTQVGKEMGFMIQSTDWKSAPAGGHQVSASLQKVTWVDSKVDLESDIPAYPTPVFTQVESVDLKTDSSGQARIAFTPAQPGDYRLELKGEGALTQMWLWVGGAGSTTWANLPNQHLKISIDASEYAPKQTAHLFIPNPFGPGALALITIERSKVMESQVIPISDSSLVYDLPITEDFAPNIYLSVTLLGRTADGRPDFRQGYQEIKVKPISETLQVAFVAQPQSAAPGSDVLLAMQVKDSDGKPVKGEFTISMVDKAVLALADANSSDIVSAFYGRNDLGVLTSLSLAGYVNRITQLFGGGKGGGGGGGSPEVRQNFADTAFWKGNVETDDHGMAQFQVNLPDNLTTWVAQVRGLTQDTRVGEAEVNVTTSKPLMVQPIVPRFGIVGDHIQLGAVVYNNTSSSLATDVALAVNGLKMDNQNLAVQKVTIDSMGSAQVNWWVSVEDVPSADLVFSAVSGSLMDQTHPEQGNLPVMRFETTQTSATVGLMTQTGSQTQSIQMPRSFVPTGGELQLEFSPSLAAAVLDGLKNEDPHGLDTNESLISTLLADINVYQALEKNKQVVPDFKLQLDKTARDHIAQLQANQNTNGGWGWTNGYETNDFMSAYVLLGLGQAAQAGYTVDSAVLQKGQQYIQNQLMAQQAMTDTSTYNRHVFMQFALQASGVANNFSGVSMDDWNASYQIVDKLSPWAEALLALGVKRVQPEGSMAGLIASDLVSKVSQMPSGVSWIENQPDEINFSSPNFNTAVVVYALAQLSVDPQTLNEAARYLVLNRHSNGAWNSSYESAWVLMGLSQMMVLNQDLQANFSFSAKLNNQLVVVTEPDKINYLDTVEQSVPFNELRLTYPNMLTINRGQGSGSLFYRIFLKANQPANTVLPVQKGLTLSRRYELSGEDCPTFPCQVVTQASLKNLKSPLTVHLTLVVPTPMYYLAVEDTIPAGVDLINRDLNITQMGKPAQPVSLNGADPFGSGWNAWYFGNPKMGDHSVRWVAEQVPAGTYELTYQIQPQYLGTYHILPAHAYQIYYPEVEASSAGDAFDIQE